MEGVRINSLSIGGTINLEVVKNLVIPDGDEVMVISSPIDRAIEIISWCGHKNCDVCHDAINEDNSIDATILLGTAIHTATKAVARGNSVYLIIAIRDSIIAFETVTGK